MRPRTRWLTLVAVAVAVAAVLVLVYGTTRRDGAEQASSDVMAEVSTPVSTDTSASTNAAVPTDTELPTDTLAPTDTAAPSAAPAPTDTAAPTDAATPTDVPAPTDVTPDPDETEYEIITLLPKDGIPAIFDPQFWTVEEAEEWYSPDELVLGVEIDGDARAYSIPFLSNREIVNDTVGGRAIAVTW
jgi:hypothetical protein